MIVEQDVRLMRRVLVALHCKQPDSAQKVVDYLRNERKLVFILPDEQNEKQREGYLVRLYDNERWLARKYGCILYPDDGRGFGDCIFLNSKWANPNTIYVRLLEPVPELEELGEIVWSPNPSIQESRELAEMNHAAYLRATEKKKKKSWWARLFG